MTLMPGRPALALLMLLAALFAGCTGASRPATTMDLTATISGAERRPEGGAFDVRTEDIEGQRRPVIGVPAGSRLTWRLTVPAHARLRLWLAVGGDCASAPVDFHVGISDGRVYEQLLVREVAAAGPSLAWQPATVDLSQYGGAQWSLFYRPSGISWSLIFNTRPGRAASCAPQPLWGAPAIETTR